MDCMDSPNKMFSASATFQKFEQRFGQLSTLDQTILDSTKVLLFLQEIDTKDRSEL